MNVNVHTTTPAITTKCFRMKSLDFVKSALVDDATHLEFMRQFREMLRGGPTLDYDLGLTTNKQRL